MDSYNNIRKGIYIAALVNFFIFLIAAAIFLYSHFQVSDNNSIDDVSVSTEKASSISADIYNRISKEVTDSLIFQEGEIVTVEDGYGYYSTDISTILIGDKQFAFQKNNDIHTIESGIGFMSTGALVSIELSDFKVESAVFVTQQPTVLLLDENHGRIFVVAGQINTKDGEIISAGEYVDWMTNRYERLEFSRVVLESSETYQELFDFINSIDL